MRTDKQVARVDARRSIAMVACEFLTGQCPPSLQGEHHTCRYLVTLGYRAMMYANTADNVLAVGAYAGQWANASGQVFIDNRDRGSTLATAQDVGLIYGKTSGGTTAAVAATQDLRLNAPTRIGWGSPVVSQLPAASSALRGYRAFVTDASVAYTSANVGSTVSAGGTNTVPVFCNGTNWVIG